VWQLFFDGASRTGPEGHIVAGVGVVLASPQNYVIPRAFSLTEPGSNNVAKYNALLIGIQIADENGVKNLKVYGDSKLIVNQVRGEYEVKHEDLVPYYNATIFMAERFGNFYINHMPRQQNAHADALASLAASLALLAGVVEKILVYSRDLYCPRVTFEDRQKPTGDFKPKKLLKLRPVQSLGIGNFRTSTMPCTASCLMIPKKRLSLDGKPPNSTIMRSREHCIADRMTGSSSAAYHKRRSRKYSKKRMTACVELISPV